MGGSVRLHSFRTASHTLVAQMFSHSLALLAVVLLGITVHQMLTMTLSDLQQQPSSRWKRTTSKCGSQSCRKHRRLLKLHLICTRPNVPTEGNASKYWPNGFYPHALIP